MKCEYVMCQKEFIGRSNKRFCSDTCRTYHSHGNTTVPGWRERQRIKNAPRCAVFVKECPITHKLFTTPHHNATYHPSLTPEQIYKYNNPPIPMQLFKCVECGSKFKGHKNTTGVCIECNNKKHRRIAKAKRRARERQLPCDSIDPHLVFDMFKWTCNECGKHTPLSARGKGYHNSPELDHRVPLSKGGTHTYDNVQCLCRECNNNKSDKLTLKLTG